MASSLPLLLRLASHAFPWPALAPAARRVRPRWLMTSRFSSSAGPSLSTAAIPGGVRREDGRPAPKAPLLRSSSRRVADTMLAATGYDEVRPLGQGSFGRVVLVQCRDSGQYFALKVQRVTKFSDSEAMECRAHLARVQSGLQGLPDGLVRRHFEEAVGPLEEKIAAMMPREDEFVSFAGDQVHRAIAERELLRHLNLTGAPFIVRLHDSFVEAGECFLFFDYAAGGTLKQYLAALRSRASGGDEAARDETAGAGTMPLASARHFLGELVLAISHLCSQSIAHRDIKTENIFISAEGHCMLADFGLATRQRSKVRTVCGTAEYIPPEVLTQSEYDPIAVDRWALGVVIYEVLAGGKTPFGDANAKAVFLNILTTTPQFPAGFPAEAEALVRSLLNHDPAARPNMRQVMEHPFFEPLDWQQIRAGASGAAPIDLSDGSDADGMTTAVNMLVGGGVGSMDGGGPILLGVGDYSPRRRRLDRESRRKLRVRKVVAATGDEDRQEESG